MPDAFAAWVCSPRRAVDWLLHAAAMDTTAMGLDRSVNPPGISTTIAHLLQALDEVKPGASALVRRVEDKEIAAIVGLWPPAFEPMRARMLGFAMHEPVVDGGAGLRRGRPEATAPGARAAADPRWMNG